MAEVLDAPILFQLTPGNGSVTLDFHLPPGSSFTDVLYATNGSDFLTLGATGGPITITTQSDGFASLVNGTHYSIALAGVSMAHPFDETTLTTNIQIFTPTASPGPPSAPQILNWTPGDGSVTLNYLIGDNGGSLVTDVLYSTDEKTTWLATGSVDGTATITTESDGVTSLVNGTNYSLFLVSVTAAANVPGDNSVNDPLIVTPSADVVPPAIPVVTQWLPGDASLTVYYTLGSDGGSDYKSVYYSTDNGVTWTDSGSYNGVAQITIQSDTLGPLVNGDTYRVMLLPITAAFSFIDPTVNIPSDRIDMTPSATSVPPDAPTITGWTPGDLTLTVSYTLGGNGGSAVIGVYYSTDGGDTWYTTGSTSGTATITALSTDGSTPLVNGTGYQVSIVAVTTDFPLANENTGSKPPVLMTPFNEVIAPSVISIKSVMPYTTSISMTYGIVSDGGSPITDIYYSTDAGTSWASSSNQLFNVVNITTTSGGYPLEAGTTYYLMLVAVTAAYPDFRENPKPINAVPVQLVQQGMTFDPPSAPSIVSPTVGDKTLTLYYTIPSTGGSFVSDVQYTTDGGTTWYSTGEKAPYGTAVITALSTDGLMLLTNGTQYYVQLVVFTDLFPVTTNPSSKLLYLTPTGTSVPPDAPTITGYVPYSGRIDVSFTLNSDGGSSLQSIFYTTDAGNTWYGVESSISGGVLTVYNTSSNQPLENGVPYTFQFAISTVDFSNASANPASAPFTMIPSDAVFTPPEPPIITSISAGDQSLTVSFDLGVLGSTLTGIFYKTDSGPWLDTKSTDSPLVLTKDSYFNPLVNGTAYSIQLVVVTVDFPVPRDNTPSESFSATPLAVPVPPDTPSSITYTPGDGTLTLSYILGSNGGSYFTAVYYTTDGGSNWNILTSTPGIGDSIITTESDGSTPLVNGNVYFVQLVSTTADFPDPTMNTPSEAIFMSPSAVILPPSAPVIVSWFGTDGALTVRYTIPTDGGSPVTDVYYSTDNGLTWDPTATTRGTAVITHTSDGLGPIVDSTTYSVRLVAVTVGFPVPYTNPKSARVFMVARPVKPGTFKPKGMSYTEFLRSKKADSPKIFNTKLLRSASEITTARRLGSSTVFALNNQGVKGSISNSIDFAQGGLHATQSYFKGEGTSRRVGSASEFTAYAGSQAIGGLVQAGLPPARILQTSNFIFVSRPVSQSASDYLRRDHGVKVSLGQPHDLEGVTPPVFVDNTVRNTGSPATVSRPAIHEIKAKNAFAYVPNRPSQAGGQYALKGDAQPGKELGALGGTTHYKAGGALRKVPYVEKHHGNDLGVNPKRPFVRYQIPAGATPVHLKINKPINSI